MRTIWKLVPLLLIGAASHCFALGIDKLSAELDVSKAFKSVDTLIVFNDDSDQTVFVTARALKWDTNTSGAFLTSPTDDLIIYPSVQKIRPGESAPFKIRYRGALVPEEANYRIFFSQIRLPSGKAVPDGDVSKTTETIDQQLMVGLAMTVPVYVSDFSIRSDLRSDISAHVEVKDGKTLINVINHGKRHATIKGYRINGTDRPGLGVVLAGRERSFAIETSDAVKTLELNMATRDGSAIIPVAGVRP